MLKQFTRKPTVTPPQVDAVQFIKGDESNQSELKRFTIQYMRDDEANLDYISTPDGAYHLEDGDYIVRDENGRFAVIKPADFTQNYDEVKTTPTPPPQAGTNPKTPPQAGGNPA